MLALVEIKISVDATDGFMMSGDDFIKKRGRRINLVIALRKTSYIHHHAENTSTLS